MSVGGEGRLGGLLAISEGVSGDGPQEGIRGHPVLSCCRLLLSAACAVYELSLTEAGLAKKPEEEPEPQAGGGGDAGDEA